ncbi:hypothetical protein U1Q18_015181, partial [Sarracenia purpurea var. burkii]
FPQEGQRSITDPELGTSLCAQLLANRQAEHRAAKTPQLNANPTAEQRNRFDEAELDA